MTLYEMWKAGQLNDIDQKKGLKPTVIPSCKAYALFVSYRNDGCKYDDAVEKTADFCCVSARSIKRAISLVTK